MLFLFLFFYFGGHIGLLFMGVLNLLKVVNETRVGYCKAEEARQFFRLLKKPDVHSVWLAKGVIFKMLQLVTFFLSFLLLTCLF